MTPLFDTHCHLQAKNFAEDLTGVLARASAVGVTRMLCCATCEDDWQAVVDLARAHQAVVPALGIHPWYLEKRSVGWLDKLEETARATGAAIGEIGIDHDGDCRNDEEQEGVFVAQIRLARSLGKPVSVHCRKAWASLIAILKREGTPDAGCVIHSYSGSADLVPQLERLGCSIAFSGSITRPNNRRGVAAATAVSANRLLVETDSPDIVPTGVAQKTNEPANLARIVETIARLRGVTSSEIGELTYRNAASLFDCTSTVRP